MQKSPTPAMLLAAWAIASQSTACGLVRSGTDDLPVAGGTSGEGGSDPDAPGVTGGSGGVPSSGGSSPVGGSTASEGGSGVLGGTGGAASTAGAGGGGATAGAGGATAGAGGATAGAGGSAGAGGGPNKIILFDGSYESFNDWVAVRNLGPNPWKNNGDGTMTVVGNTGDIQSKQKFRNVFVHLEYMAPQVQSTSIPELLGNSGVFLNGSYGLRITDSYGLPPTVQSCGSVYGLNAPLEVACHELGVWNTYEIEFQAPTCDDEYPTMIVTPARFVEVKLNGTLIHRNVDVLMQTQAGQAQSCEPRGLLLQDVGSLVPVSFRNIWAIPRN